MKVSVIFGGNGFVGTLFARYLLDLQLADKVYLYDNEKVIEKCNKFREELVACDSRLVFVEGNVQYPIRFEPSESISLIANFAAVHREPGHNSYEYYQTNLLGAENVCNFAERVGCNRVIFTSSISPYGPSEKEKDESSLPVPVTAYGGSKLVAEKIHKTWQAKDLENRRLVIVRPGVVFGPGEGGNVSRLIRAVLRRYFFYMGNRSTRKAGVYVKELCHAMQWVLESQEKHGERVSLFNMTMNPGPSIQEYVDTICEVANVKRIVPSVPYRLLLAVAYGLEVIARPFGVQHPFSPVRIRKLVRSNNILPNYLVEKGYPYQYTLKSAFEDWKKECPEEWK
ncbi:NAD-dependent epimerase/dehydratase family protein [Marinobacter sp.]|uniref:NAD-dependent epimerase/dehydratase family protein n=1 Tax=Marinobacter sp. TaxID=50741 RepID=UPI003A9403DC